jgi:hypothetical protein
MKLSEAIAVLQKELDENGDAVLFGTDMRGPVPFKVEVEELGDQSRVINFKHLGCTGRDTNRWVIHLEVGVTRDPTVVYTWDLNHDPTAIHQKDLGSL